MTYYGKEPEEGVVTDLSDWCVDIRDRLAHIANMISGLPGGWAIADRIRGLRVDPPTLYSACPSTLLLPKILRSVFAQAKSVHGDHERWPTIEVMFDAVINEDMTIYTAVARLLADNEDA